MQRIKKFKQPIITAFILSTLYFAGSFLVPHDTYAVVDPGGAGGSGNTSQTEPECRKATTLSDNCIVKNINTIVNFLSIGVGIVVIAMLIVGGIQYSLAGDKPEAVNAAKQRLINAIIALFAYLFLFAFVQWLVPGGVF